MIEIELRVAFISLPLYRWLPFEFRNKDEYDGKEVLEKGERK